MKSYKHNPKLATIVVTKESGTLIRLPNGDMLSGIVFTRVHDHMNEPTTCIVKFHCNLEFTDNK